MSTSEISRSQICGFWKKIKSGGTAYSGHKGVKQAVGADESWRGLFKFHLKLL